jgi:hypothetical protein
LSMVAVLTGVLFDRPWADLAVREPGVVPRDQRALLGSGLPI